MIPDLSPHFLELSEQLRTLQSYWRPMAFQEPRLPWMQHHPLLVQRLLALSPAAIDDLATDADALTAFMAPDLAFAQPLKTLCQLAELRDHVVPVLPARFQAGIPGRKWQQLEAFAACIPPSEIPLLEWCSGKSHLGFYLHHYTQQAVTALEWDAALVTQANARAQRENIPLHAFEVDVLSGDVARFMSSHQQVVALHACGELHETLLQHCVQHNVKQVHLSPCCYHKRTDDQYQPLSQLARSQALPMSKRELHTAVMETVTAGASVRRQRVRAQIMRLGFDCLQRDIRQEQNFLPVPSLPAKWARATFEEFCQHCAALKGLQLPSAINWDYYWRCGERRFQEVSAFDLVRFLFRRPLEIWLALDRALLLQEHGYRTRLGVFCAARITPRNLLLQAVRD